MATLERLVCKRGAHHLIRVHVISESDRQPEADTQRDKDECSGCEFFFFIPPVYFDFISFSSRPSRSVIKQSDAPRSLTENEEVERKNIQRMMRYPHLSVLGIVWSEKKKRN